MRGGRGLRSEGGTVPPAPAPGPSHGGRHMTGAGDGGGACASLAWRLPRLRGAPTVPASGDPTGHRRAGRWQAPPTQHRWSAAPGARGMAGERAVVRQEASTHAVEAAASRMRAPRRIISGRPPGDPREAVCPASPLLPDDAVVHEPWVSEDDQCVDYQKDEQRH